MAKTRVALIYGGASGEHSVSCMTAASVLRAMDPDKYDVVPIGIRRDGTWVPGSADPDALEAAGLQGEVGGSPSRVLMEIGGTPRALTVVESEGGAPVVEALGSFDVAFPLLHGPFGEDGTIQGFLEMAGVPYVGCGVFASAAGMDKHFMKVVLESAGIAVAPYVLVAPRRWRTEKGQILAEIAEKLTFPVFVKPARAGSSLGIVRVDAPEGLEEAVVRAQGTDPKVIVEQGIAGREIECAVLGGHGDDAPRTSVLGEIVMDSAQWYDYETKYVQTEGFHMAIPARVDEPVATRIRETAARVFEAFGCEGMTRVDFFLTEAGEVFVNEHNTTPGFTQFSMYPLLWPAVRAADRRAHRPGARAPRRTPIAANGAGGGPRGGGAAPAEPSPPS